MTRKPLISALSVLSLLSFFLTELQALPTHDSQNKELPTLAPMLEKVTPAVVNISAKRMDVGGGRSHQVLSVA